MDIIAEMSDALDRIKRGVPLTGEQYVALDLNRLSQLALIETLSTTNQILAAIKEKLDAL
jgi:hypothetical protein